MRGQNRFAYIFFAAILLSGCRKNRLPDPQVIHGPAPASAIQGNPADTGKSKQIITATATSSATPSAAVPSSTPTETPAPSETPIVLAYKVPVVSQDGLFLEGIPTGVGCVPACIEMMTAWWNSTEPLHPVLTAQEVIDRMRNRGYMSPDAACPP